MRTVIPPPQCSSPAFPGHTTDGWALHRQPLQMTAVDSLFEVHLAVTDLSRAIAFYSEVVGLRLAHTEPARQAAFLWIGQPGRAMLGLWGTGSAPQTFTAHTAFRVTVADVHAAPAALTAAGVTPLDFNGRPTLQPIVFAWMPAASVFFRDPDGHLLEYIAVLQQDPRPECGVVTWRMWEQLQHATLPFEV